MLDNQTGVDKQNDGIVKCRTTDPEIFMIHHLRIEHIYVKMSVYRIDGVEYGITFGGLAMPVRIKIFRKYLSYRIFYVLSFHIGTKLAPTKLSLFYRKQK